MRLIPAESATILGRNAQAYTIPVIASSTATAARAPRWRPWTGRSTRMMTATTNHAQDKMSDPALRKTSGSLSGSFRDDSCCDNTTGLQARGGRAARRYWRQGQAPRNLAPAYCMPPGGVPVTGSGADAVRQPVRHRRAVRVQRRQGGGGHQPHARADRPLVHVEDGLVDIEVPGRPRGPGSQPGQAAGNRL